MPISYVWSKYPIIGYIKYSVPIIIFIGNDKPNFNTLFKNGKTDTQALIAALNSGYNIVDGNNKTYTITSEVSIPSNIELRNLTILRGFEGGVAIRNKENTTNITLNNVSLLHNDFGSTGLLLLKCKN